MMDHFLEEVVRKHNRVVDEIAYYVSMVLMVLCALFGAMELFGSINMIPQYGFVRVLPDLILALLLLGMAAGIFFFRDRLRTEYEYALTNDSMDFAMVFNNQKRKNLGTLKLKNVDAFGPVASAAFERYISMPNVKQNRWFLNRGAQLYYFYFQKEGNKRIIVIEPSEEMVKLIRQQLPHGVWQE